MITMIYKKNHPELPKEVMSMFDLGFLGVEDDYPEQKSSLPIQKGKGLRTYWCSKKSTTGIILERG